MWSSYLQTLLSILSVAASCPCHLLYLYPCHLLYLYPCHLLYLYPYHLLYLYPTSIPITCFLQSILSVATSTSAAANLLQSIAASNLLLFDSTSAAANLLQSTAASNLLLSDSCQLSLSLALPLSVPLALRLCLSFPSPHPLQSFAAINHCSFSVIN